MAAARSNRPYNTLCFSGGGVRGVAYFGALKVLRKHGVVDWMRRDRAVQHFIGTSVGALFAMLTYARVDLYVAKAMDLVRAFLNLFAVEPRNLFRGARYGLGTGAQCVRFLHDLLYKTHGKRRITFVELHQIVGGDLTLVTTSVKTGKPVYLSHHTHPFVEVADAVFGSMTIPFLFEPKVLRVRGPDALFQLDACYVPYLQVGLVFDHGEQEHEVLHVDKTQLRLRTATYDRVHVIDGCFVNNNAYDLAPAGARILNLCLHREKPFDVGHAGLLNYVTRVMSISSHRVEELQDQFLRDQYDRDVLRIATSMTSTNFGLSDAALADLSVLGAEAASRFLREHGYADEAAAGQQAVATKAATASAGIGTDARPSTGGQRLQASSRRWQEQQPLPTFHIQRSRATSGVQPVNLSGPNAPPRAQQDRRVARELERVKEEEEEDEAVDGTDETSTETSEDEESQEADGDGSDNQPDTDRE